MAVVLTNSTVNRSINSRDRYCAPERARSSGQGESCLATKASDIWSVGMVLYWLLTGQVDTCLGVGIACMSWEGAIRTPAKTIRNRRQKCAITQLFYKINCISCTLTSSILTMCGRKIGSIPPSVSTFTTTIFKVLIASTAHRLSQAFENRPF